MARLLFVLNHSTDLPERAMTAVLAARANQQAGAEVGLWLQNEGVRLGVEGVAETLREPGPVTAAEAIEALVERGAVLHCSSPCFALREFEDGALRRGATLAPPEVLGRLGEDGWVPVPT